MDVLTLADKLREARATLLEMAGVFNGTPHGDQIEHLAAALPDPEEVARMEDCAIEHRDCPVELRMAGERNHNLQKQRDELAVALGVEEGWRRKLQKQYTELRTEAMKLTDLLKRVVEGK